MDKPSFNLVSDPWIKVIRSDNYQIDEVSLTNLFEHASEFARLAGESPAQDLALIRLLLAILHTVYSRYDAEGEVYDWLDVDTATMKPLAAPDEDDFDSDDLMQTWIEVKRRGGFGTIVGKYLDCYQRRFDLFGDKPFYQVTQAQYDASVPANKKVETGSGTVAIRQLNREISESGNSPSLFAPRDEETKDDISFAELTRWLITYQNYTGVTDKTKVNTPEKFSNSAGWLYRLNPVYVTGHSVFETLLFNLVLIPNNQTTYAIEKPVWEWDNPLEYVAYRKQQLQPTNLAELYTTWSRLLCIQWHEERGPQIFSAGLPIFSADNAYLEPMTTWRWIKKDQVNRPQSKSLESLNRQMWRNFGEYIDLHNDNNSRQPGVVTWLQALKVQRAISRDMPVTLATAALISDGNATSQAPAAEVGEEMAVRAGVLFDEDGKQYWPARIEEAIDITKEVAKAYWIFLANLQKLRGIDDKQVTNRSQAKYFQQLNMPFKNWLASLKASDDRDQRLIEWKKELRSILYTTVNSDLQTATPRDIAGMVVKKDNGDQESNIFTLYRQLKLSVAKTLDLPKEEIS